MSRAANLIGIYSVFNRSSCKAGLGRSKL